MDEKKEYDEKYKEFQEKFGNFIFRVFEIMTAEVEEKYGREMSLGFVLALDTIYMAITGNSLEERVFNKVKKGEQ